MKLSSLATPLFVKIGGGIIAALLLYVGIVHWQLSNVRDDLKASRQETANEKAEHKITLASLSDTRLAMDQQNAAVLAMKADAEKRTKASQNALRTAQNANRAQAGQIDRLKASGAQKRAGGPCEVSETLKGVQGL